MRHDALTMNTVSIEGRALAKALHPILSVIEKRNTYPILGFVRLAVEGSHLTFTGTDLDIAVTIHLDVNEANGNWQTCVDPRVLAGIGRQAGPALVEIALSGTEVRGVEATIIPEVIVKIEDAAEYVLPCLGVEAFPDVAGQRGDLIERFTNGRLPIMLGKVAAYISTEETRYYLNGVCWQIGSNGRRFVATDGHRLGMCTYDTDKGTKVQDLIIPRKAVKLMRAVLGGEDVSLYAVARKQGEASYVGGIDIVAGNLTIRTKVIEGTYPDVNRVLPKIENITHQISAPRQELLDAIDRASIIRSKSRFGGTAVRFFGEGEVLHIETNSPDAGKARSNTKVAWPGGCTDFGLNAAYIRDMVSQCDGAVTMHVKDANSPFLIADEDPQMTRVLMPMRV